MRVRPDWSFEREAWAGGFRAVAGLDEAGRGALAGPVSAAAVILDPEKPIEGLDDSKKLSPRVRERLYGEIVARARAWSVIFVEAGEIDRINILQATIRAMLEASRTLAIPPDCLLIDALPLPRAGMPYRAIIGGDGKSVSIAAASIVAKVTRDRFMTGADCLHPGYGFAAHKGYGTQAHLDALRDRGPCVLHRLTFRRARTGDILPV